MSQNRSSSAFNVNRIESNLNPGTLSVPAQENFSNAGVLNNDQTSSDSFYGYQYTESIASTQETDQSDSTTRILFKSDDTQPLESADDKKAARSPYLIYKNKLNQRDSPLNAN